MIVNVNGKEAAAITTPTKRTATALSNYHNELFEVERHAIGLIKTLDLIVCPHEFVMYPGRPLPKNWNPWMDFKDDCNDFMLRCQFVWDKFLDVYGVDEKDAHKIAFRVLVRSPYAPSDYVLAESAGAACAAPNVTTQ